MHLDWKKINSERGADLKLFQVRYDDLQNPRNQKTERMIILEGNDSTNVVPVLPNGDIVFVRQYRFGIEQTTLELPGGIVDEGEESGFAARRELREETGYASEQWAYLGKIASNPVFMDSYIHHWVAKAASLQFELDLDEGELVEAVILTEKQVRKYLHTARFLHPHTVSALVLYFAQQAEEG